MLAMICLSWIIAGTLAMTIGAAFTNTNASAITSLTISYTGEQWRLGTAARTGTLTDQLDFAFSLDATSLSTGSWNDVNSLDFITPNTLGTVGLRPAPGSLRDISLDGFRCSDELVGALGMALR